MQLRISEVDASGRVVSSVTRPVFGTVPGEDRAYFDVQVPSSPSYQVAVQSFDFLDLSRYKFEPAAARSDPPLGGQMAAIRMDRRAFLHAMARR